MRCEGDGVSRREWALLAAVWLVLFLAAASVARYGLDPGDEGAVLYPSVQVAQGLVPYRDFSALYTPLTWYLHAALFRLTGVEIVAVRVLFAAVGAALVVGVYLLARQFVRPAFAVVPLVSYMLLFPIPHYWAPYPAWYALAGALVALLATLRWIEERRDGWLVGAGAGCAFAFASKPNVGLFGALALGGFLVLAGDRLFPKAHAEQARTGGPALRALSLTAIVFVFWLLLRGAARPGNQVLFLGSLAAAGLASFPPRASFRVRGPLRSILLLAAGFLAPTLPWYAALSSVAGWQTTFDAVFLQGARTAEAFYAPVLLPSRDAVEGLAWPAAGFLAAVGLGWAGRRRAALRPRLLIGLAALSIIAIAVLSVRASATGVSPLQYLATNLNTRLQRTATEETDLATYLPFALLWLGIGLVVASRRWPDGPRARPPRLELLVWFLAIFLFQLYPRASYMHALFVVGPFLPVLAIARARVWRSLRGGVRHPLARAAAFAPLLVFPALLVPGAWQLRARGLQQSPYLPLPHAGIYTNNGGKLERLTARIAELPPGEPIFTYPMSPLLYLLTDRPNPTRENHLQPGYVDQRGQADVIQRLEATRTRYVVWDQEMVNRWGLRASDRLLVDYLWRRYAPVLGQAGGWLLLERQP